MKKRRVLMVTALLGLSAVLNVQSQELLLDFLNNEIVDTYGLTTYGEPCTDECTHRGFSYAWCHKAPSRNGTWTDRDYCSPSPGVTRYGERCLDNCSRKKNQPYFTCGTKVTKRGDWDYCSPFPTDLVCQWSQWGPWSECSKQCGSKSTKTRRRRMEQLGSNGRVGRCSGEIEQSIKSCQGPPCSDARPSDCIWSSWSQWSSCSVTCGSGGVQSRSRSIATPASLNGKACNDRDSTQTILCSRAESCPTTSTTTTTTTTTTKRPITEKIYLGQFNNYKHGINGDLYSMGPKRILIQNFQYDGTGPDAFFWAGVQGSNPSSDGILLVHPFRGKFYQKNDPSAPSLKRFTGQTILLTLPDSVEVGDLKWLSVWSRLFRDNFGDFIFEDQDDNSEESFEVTTSRIVSFSTTTTTRSLNVPEAPRSIPKLKLKNSQNNPISTIPKFGNNKSQTNPISTDGQKLRNKIEEILFKHQQKTAAAAAKKKTENNNQQENNSSHKKAGNSNEDNEDEDAQPFTVVRVSSSVSQIRPNTQHLSNNNSNKLSEEEEEKEDNATRLTPNTSTIGTIRDLFTTTTTTTTTPRKITTKKAGNSNRARPPFLRPKTKFVDIKIPALEKPRNNENNSNKNKHFSRPSTTITQQKNKNNNNDDLQDKVSNLFSNRRRPPINAILRKTTTTTTRSTTTTATSPTTTTTKATSTFTPFLEEIPHEETTIVSSILDQLEVSNEQNQNKNSPGVANFARIPLTKFKMQEGSEEDNISTLTEDKPDLPPPEVVTFAPNAVTISAINNEGVTRLLEVVKINKNNKQTAENVNNNQDDALSAPIIPSKDTVEVENNDGGKRLLEIVEIKRPPGFKPSQEIFRETTTVTNNPETEITTTTTETTTTTRKDPPFVNTNGATRLLEVLQKKKQPSKIRETTTTTTEATTTTTRTPTPIFGARSTTTRPRRPTTTAAATTRARARPSARSTTSTPLTTIDTTQSTEIPESTPEEKPRKQNGRGGSRFRNASNRIKSLFNSDRRKNRFRQLNRNRSSRPTETPDLLTTSLTTTNEDITLSGFGARSTEKSVKLPEITTSVPVPDSISTTQRNRLTDFFRSRGTRRPFNFKSRANRIRTTRAPISILARSSTTSKPEVSGNTFNTVTTSPFAVTRDIISIQSSTIRPTEEERAQTIEKLMKDEKEKAITQFYPDYDYEDEEEEEEKIRIIKPDIANRFRPNRPKFTLSPKFRSTTPIPDFDEITERNQFISSSITPIPSIVLVSTTEGGNSGYDPCAIPDSCGPNAKCSVRLSDPVCSCPSGFSGIPRDGVPDPSHGCVRTPQKCSEGLLGVPGLGPQCPSGQSCVRDLCLPDCSGDGECALGERCVNSTCTKICFYDAHCLAGEFCEKDDTSEGLTGSNGVCLAGCRRDTNCPFGQVCQIDSSGINTRGKCEPGCHFNNDCTMGTACINGNCTDPCIGFDECGANAVCETVSHSATCKCPEGTRELNSPYVACVPADMDLSTISCLRDSDCSFGLSCQDWQCRPATARARTRKRIR